MVSVANVELGSTVVARSTPVLETVGAGLKEEGV
jgi:hypothetical protein